MAATIQRKIWLGIVALLCSLAVILLASPDQAQADTRLSYSGYAGPSSLSDSYYNPAAGCSYTWNTVGVGVYGPNVNVWARSNYTNGQWVSYGFRVFEQNKYHPYSWTRIGTSSQKYALAYPGKRAALGNTWGNWYKEYTTGPNYVYHKVLIDIYWYNYSGAVSGTTTRQVDYYLSKGGFRANSCFY